MAKTDLTPQQKEVLGILADNPQGVDVRQIIQSLQAPPHKRTVQRWLTALAAQGHISVVGKGRATLYRLSARSGQYDKLITPTDDKAREDYELYIPISREGREIMAYVRQSRTGRTPAGYERGFLSRHFLLWCNCPIYSLLRMSTKEYPGSVQIFHSGILQKIKYP